MTDSVNTSVTDKQIVEAILADSPDHAPGTRPIHAIGIACEGYFSPLEAAPNYCIAPQCLTSAPLGHIEGFS